MARHNAQDPKLSHLRNWERNQVLANLRDHPNELLIRQTSEATPGLGSTGRLAQELEYLETVESQRRTKARRRDEQGGCDVSAGQNGDAAGV